MRRVCFEVWTAPTDGGAQSVELVERVTESPHPGGLDSQYVG